MSKVKVLILRAPGTNCDVETAFAFEQAGAETTRAHINRLIGGDAHLADYRILALPGGFSYGDDISAGKVLANELRLGLGDEIRRFIAGGGLILGICNGFQTLVKSGFFAGPAGGDAQPFTLTDNDTARYECRWVNLAVNPDSPCVFTRGIERMELPVAHAEGKIVVAAEDSLPDRNAVLFYTDEDGKRGAGFPHNPNGSDRDIAGVCDETGRVFALMPHPERFIRRTQHPRWTRRGGPEAGDGFRIFQNAVDWAKSN